MTNPQRGEIWLVNLDPTQGQEIQKTRPAVIISSDVFSAIGLRIVIPVTSWQERFCERPFMVPIEATQDTGLKQRSAGNVLQVRSVSTQRIVKKLGEISDATMKDLLAGLVICIDYTP